MKLAVFGGTFNPIHTGHLILADKILHHFSYDKILFVPTACSPFKTDQILPSDSQRLKMLRLALKDNPCFEIEDWELKQGGISYTIDTINYLEKKYANCLDEKIGLILGDDHVEKFHLWKNAEELASKTTIILGTRFKQVSELQFNHISVDNEKIPISSTEIRKSIREGKSWQYFVPAKVANFIKKQGLYE